MTSSPLQPTQPPTAEQLRETLPEVVREEGIEEGIEAAVEVEEQEGDGRDEEVLVRVVTSCCPRLPQEAHVVR